MSSIVLPSLYIPRLVPLSSHMDEKKISKVFDTYFESSLIETIDLVKRKDSVYKKDYKMAFIHFKENASLPSHHPFALKLDTLEHGGDVKLLIDDSHYWIIRKNVGSKRETNPFDPTSPISKEVESTPRIKTYEPTTIKNIDYSLKMPYTYPFPEIQNKENCYIIHALFFDTDVLICCKRVCHILQRIWGVTYDIMQLGCMWKCKYLGFNFVIDLWNFTEGECLLLLEIRNIDCDDATFNDLRNHIFEKLN